MSLVVDLLELPALMSCVVRADHEHDFLRLETVEVAVLQPPQDMFRAVAADAEIRGLQRRPILLPHRFAFGFPAVRNGVAEEHELGLAFLAKSSLKDSCRASVPGMRLSARPRSFSGPGRLPRRAKKRRKGKGGGGAFSCWQWRDWTMPGDHGEGPVVFAPLPMIGVSSGGSVALPAPRSTLPTPPLAHPRISR